MQCEVHLPQHPPGEVPLPQHPPGEVSLYDPSRRSASTVTPSNAKSCEKTHDTEHNVFCVSERIVKLTQYNNNNNNNLLTATGLLPGGSSFVHVHNYGKGAKNLKSGGLHEKHAVATWSLGNQLSICL